MTRGWWAGRWVWAVAVGVVLAISVWSFAYVEPGERPPAFALKDLGGKDVTLADFKGRPVVINFWATWCGPCKAEIPAFVELADKYREQGLTILGVSTDDRAEELPPFMSEFKMNYPVLIGRDHEDLLEAYNAAYSIPVTWFIKADGTVHMKKFGPATKEWFEEQIKALF